MYRLVADDGPAGYRPRRDKSEKKNLKQYFEFLQWVEEREGKKKAEADKNKPPQKNFNFLERFIFAAVFGPIVGSLWLVASVQSIQWAVVTLKTVIH